MVPRWEVGKHDCDLCTAAVAFHERGGVEEILALALVMGMSVTDLMTEKLVWSEFRRVP